MQDRIDTGLACLTVVAKYHKIPTDMRQLEREIGRDAALAYTERVTTDVLVYSQDWHDIDGTRNEMGWELEELNAEH